MESYSLISLVRSRAGLSLRELGNRAGTSHSTLSAYESDRKNPTVETLNRVVRAAGFDVAAEIRPRVGGVDPADRGRELLEVLELAAQFPARHDSDLRYPPFGRR